MIMLFFCLFYMFLFLMLRRPPRSTRTDTRFPYTTLFRSFFFGKTGGGQAEDLGLDLRRVDVVVFAVIAPEFRGFSDQRVHDDQELRSEEHTSELQSLMRTSYAVFCLKKKKKTYTIYKLTYDITNYR